MDQATVFTKTAKGITQVNQRSASLSKDLMKVLKMIDGKSNFAQIMEKAELDKNQLEKALNTLTKDGFARVFQTKKEEIDPFGDDTAAAAAGGGGDDFDFTAPGKMPAATQRVIPGAANDVTALAAQHAKQEADRKAKEAAHAAAAAKAKAEAQVRAKLEAEAKARQEAERQAMEQAQRAKEAADRARAEVELQQRQEEARQKAIAEQQVKLTAEQKAKEEAESRRLAELRVKAEREAKALAEARARAEAEAAAMAKARAEAEAAAKKQAAEAQQAQAEMKARLKEEIEARIRGEMEQLLREQAEAKEDSEQAREEMKAQILAEAKMAAQAELEERLREERETIARAEAEARTKAEREAGARAEEESKKRIEAEARAKAETEARIRAEDEAKRLRAQVEQANRTAAEAAERAKQEAAQAAAQAAARAKQEGEEEAKRLRAQVEAEAKRAAEAAARARQEAEARAREAAAVEKQLDAERQAKYEAEARAKIEAEERAKREAELAGEIEAERKAKQEAEARARLEAKARETMEVDTRARVQAELESDLGKKAEIEGKAQAKAYMEAKARAEQEEEQKMRDEQARRAREIAEVLRTRVEAQEDAGDSTPRKRARRREGSIVKPIIFGFVLLLVAAVAALHVIPLRTYTAKVEKSLGEWLQDDVSIGSMTFRLVPTPHLRVENLAVGKSLDAKAASGRVDLDILSLFGDKPSIRSIDLDGVSLTPEAVRRIPRWARTEGKGGSNLERINLRSVKLDTRPALDAFNALLTFGNDGAMKQAQLTASTWSVTVRPSEKGLDFDASLRGFTLPIGAPIQLSHGSFKGTFAGNELVVPEFEANTLEGKANGALKVTWGQNVRLESEFTLDKVSAPQLVGAFTKAIAVNGKVDGNFTLATEGPSLEALFAHPRVQGKFKLGEGSISNVDLVAVMQSDSAGSRAGVTKFNELTGELASVDQRSQFRQVNLQGGVLRGNGTIEVASTGNLSGRAILEIRSQVASDRGSFSVSGTVSRPIIKRGG
ncbi:MAG TPA: AsmA-like C-terminal region-containing protein [Usitatibacter sp.]|nr:AsmA-like C-terminal region-containing protein [Usitatibacter sp.]